MHVAPASTTTPAGMPPVAPRWPRVAGALLAAVSIALAAYASHGVGGAMQARLQLAAVFGFGHGLALVALAPWAVRGLPRLSLAGLLAGVLLFSGSLAASHWLGSSTALAPFGGGLMILGWLLLAVDAMRR